MRTILPLLSLCVFAASVFADQVTMKNGDRVTGTIIKKDGKTLTIKTEAFGQITTPWAQVKTISTTQPVSVELTGGEVVRGKLQPAESRIEITSEDARRAVELERITALRNAAEQRAYERLLAPPWTRLWTGNLTFEVAGTQGNAETLTLTSGLNASRITRHDKTSVHLNAIKASALIDGISATTAKAVRGGVAYSRNIGSRMFINGFNDYEFDRFQNLDLRFVLGGGAGFAAWKFERSRLDLLSGGAFNRETFSRSSTEPGFSRRSGEIYFGDDFTFKVNGATSMYQNSRFFTNLSNAGQYRFNLDLGANTKLTRWLTWNSSLSNRYLSNPVQGRQGNDFLYSTGIGVGFSH